MAAARPFDISATTPPPGGGARSNSTARVVFGPCSRRDGAHRDEQRLERQYPRHRPPNEDSSAEAVDVVSPPPIRHRVDDQSLSCATTWFEPPEASIVDRWITTEVRPAATGRRYSASTSEAGRRRTFA